MKKQVKAKSDRKERRSSIPEKKAKNTSRVRTGGKKADGMKQMKLRTRLAGQIGAMILILLVVMIVFVDVVAGQLILRGTEKDLKDVSLRNAAKIEAIADGIDTISQPIIGSVNEMISNELIGNKTHKSLLSDDLLSDARFTEEQFLTTMIWSYLLASPDKYNAIGVYFPEGKFMIGMQQYGIYASQKDISSMKPQRFTLEQVNAVPALSKALETSTIQYSDPIHDEEKDTYSIYAAFPIVIKQETYGIAFVNMPIEIFAGVADDNEDSYQTAIIDVINANKLVTYTTASGVGKGFDDFLGKEAGAEIRANMEAGQIFQMETNSNGYHKIRSFAPVQIGDSIWWSQTSITYQEYIKYVMALIIVMTVAVIVMMVVILFVSSHVFKKALHPLEEVSVYARTIADGDFSASMQYKYQDEIGSLIDSMQTMVGRMKSIFGDMGDKLRAMGQGDFSFDNNNSELYIGAYAPLQESMETITTDMNQTIRKIREASDQVSSGSTQVSSGAQALAQGSTEQASSVEELSATMNEIASKIRETSDKTTEAARIGITAGEAVEISNQKMMELNAAMDDITQKASQIGSIIKTIDDIAFQTNILALNASIEAARAGSAGKGFAVVADEVGNLAGKSSEAAQTIAELISETISSVDHGAKITHETAVSMEEVSVNTRKISDLMDSVAQATEEENNSVQQITQGIGQISAVVQTNSATAEQSAAASEELSNQAEIMDHLVSGFRLRQDI